MDKRRGADRGGVDPQSGPGEGREVSRGGGFEALWQPHEAEVVALARRILARHGQDHEAVDELVQETRIALFLAVQKCGLAEFAAQLRSNLSQHLYGVVVRRAADAARSRAHHPVVVASELPAGRGALDDLLDQGSFADDPALLVPEYLDRRATAARILAAIERLPASQRHAVELVHLYGTTYPEAAAALGLAVGTVKRQVHDGVQAVRRRAEAEGWTP